jgi:hypothetical protein
MDTPGAHRWAILVLQTRQHVDRHQVRRQAHCCSGQRSKSLLGRRGACDQGIDILGYVCFHTLHPRLELAWILLVRRGCSVWKQT